MVAWDGIEPPTQGFSVLCSTDWATKPFLKWRSRRESNPRSPAWQAGMLTATPLDLFGCGDRTWTCDLRVMSPTSYQLLHPAMNGGGRRIRTFEVEDGRFTVCSLWPLGNPSKNKMELAIGIEPTTCWLQVSCSTNWATPASLRQDVFYHPSH